MKKTFIFLLFLIIVFLLVTPIILYFGSKFYNHTYHKFWSTQPVSFYHTLKFSDGIINNDKPPKSITDERYLIDSFTNNDDNIKDMLELLNKNYSISNKCIYQYDEEYLNWIFNNENKERINLCLSKDSKMIGCITSRPTTLVLKGEKLKCLYVDNLCIDQDYRNQGIAPILISHMSNYGYEKGYNLFIYQRESYKLPYRSIALTENYIYQLKKYNLGTYQLTSLNDENLKQVYDFYSNYFQDKDNYIEYSFTDFSYYFMNKWVTCYIEFKNNQIINLVVLQDNKYQLNNQKVIEVPYVIITDDIQNHFIKKVFNQCLENGYNLVCNKNQQNQKFFSELKTSDSFVSFIYMYNYHLVSPLIKHELIFL